ncbi:MAG: thioredoxin [bacterium]|jgi:thioredoxin 1
MASNKVVHLTDANFDEETKSGYALVDFWAEWCGPCRAIAPTIDKIADDMDGKLKVCKVDVDQHQEAAMRFGVRGIPFVVLLKDGQPVGNVVGADPGRIASLAEMAA